MIGPLTYLDLGLIAVAFISGLLAMYRGFSRELLSIVSWLAAAGAAFFFVFNYRGVSEDIAAQMGLADKVWVGQVAVGAVIFLIVLIIVHLITSRISDSILDSRVGMIDRLLGFVFGVVRGFLLVLIPYMFYDSFIPDVNAQAEWVRNSLSQPYLKSTGDTIKATIETYRPTSGFGQPAAPPATPEAPPPE